MEESLSKFMPEFAKRHDENSNLIKEIRAATDAAIRNQGASIKALEIQIGQMGKVLQERGSGSLPGSTETNPRDHVKSISTTVEADTPSIRLALEDSLPLKEKDPGSFTLHCYINNICFEKALADLGSSVSVMPLSTFTNLGLGELAPTKLTVELADRTISTPKGIKVPLILGRPFLSTAHAKLDVFERKITLRVGDDKITFKSVKPTSSLIKRVYVLGLRKRMDLDLEARLMGETLILNRSLDPDFGDFIELNDLNEPLEFRRNQVEDLGPTIEEGEVIDKPMVDTVETRNEDGKIEGINEYLSFCDHVVESMDPYRDQEMGDVIVGELFCREICVKARRFDGMITIYNGLNTAYPGLQIRRILVYRYGVSTSCISGTGNVSGTGDVTPTAFPCNIGGGYPYHRRIQALADAAREHGLQF
ncbi:mitochondrial proton/calcium exchanger protein-like protein isoform X1 [Tanacetum coccineum]